MLFRTRPLPATLIVLCLLLASCARPGETELAAARATEAEKLYRRANDYVSRLTEGVYSYAYMQFYWKRAQANVDRILRSYADTPTGASLQAGELKLGPYELDYFRDRVLPWLETKRLAAADEIYCAIFLYNTDEARQDETRLAAFARIIEVLSRRKRWGEALDFPVLPEHRPLLLASVARIAVRFNQEKVVDDLLDTATPEEQAVLYPLLGNALAVRGVPRDEIAAFLDEHPGDDIKLSVFSGMTERESKIQRAGALRIPLKDVLIQGGALEEPEVRDDVDEVARQFFPDGNREASRLLAEYRAGLGNLEAARAIAAAAGLRDLTGVYLAWLDHLAAFEKYDELTAFPSQARLPPDQRRGCELKIVELLARSGRLSESGRALEEFIKTGAPDPAAADLARLQWFRGRMQATDENQLVVRANTFAEIPFKDPCVMAQAIMEWSLTPNKTVRGAAPWDAVVRKFAGGFENLPEPKSREVQKAASELKPY